MPFGRSIPLTYATAVTGLLFLQHAFDSYLSQRQLRRLHHRSLPSSLQSYFNLLTTSSNTNKDSNDSNKDITSNFLASQEYSKDKLRLSQVSQLIDLVENCLFYTPFVTTFILTGYKRPVSGLKALWDYSTSFDFVKDKGEIVQSLAFITAVNLISKLTSVPMSLYRPFVLEAKVRVLSPLNNPILESTCLTEYIYIYI